MWFISVDEAGVHNVFASVVTVNRNRNRGVLLLLSVVVTAMV